MKYPAFHSDTLYKRIFDLFLACFSLVAFFPVMLITGFIIGIKHGRPIIFKQLRPGLNGRIFVIYKFRTMLDRYDAKGGLIPDAMRLTPFGRFLRATSLDELPELVNIIKGDMSFVGPRPLLIQYMDRYNEEQARRQNVRPGLTGWAQMNGRNAITWEEKFEFDVWYVDNRSFWLDLKIIALTVKKVILREGISHMGEATMSEFMGTDMHKE